MDVRVQVPLSAPIRIINTILLEQTKALGFEYY